MLVKSIVGLTFSSRNVFTYFILVKIVLYWWDGTPTEKFKTPSSSRSHNRLLEWCLQMCFVIFFPIVILCLFKRFSSIFFFLLFFVVFNAWCLFFTLFLSANWLFQISPLLHVMLDSFKVINKNHFFKSRWPCLGS